MLRETYGLRTEQHHERLTRTTRYDEDLQEERKKANGMSCIDLDTCLYNFKMIRETLL